MPRLLLFAPCERVIIGQGDNSVSLIVVIQEMKFQTFGQAQDIKEDQAVSARFTIFSQWYASSGDEGKGYEQRIALGLAGEKAVIEATAEFQFSNNIKMMRIAAQVPLMPILKPGEYSLTLCLREKGESEWSKAVADYPLMITHAVTDPVQV